MWVAAQTWDRQNFLSGPTLVPVSSALVPSSSAGLNAPKHRSEHQKSKYMIVRDFCKKNIKKYVFISEKIKFEKYFSSSSFGNNQQIITRLQQTVERQTQLPKL